MLNILAMSEVVYRIDIAFAAVLALDCDGLRTITIGIVDIQVGIGPLLL